MLCLCRQTAAVSYLPVLVNLLLDTAPCYYRDYSEPDVTRRAERHVYDTTRFLHAPRCTEFGLAREVAMDSTHHHVDLRTRVYVLFIIYLLPRLRAFPECIEFFPSYRTAPAATEMQ